ncbi:hypothetical protein HanPI659440_Chr12g0475991 [Helianthus annuus]|nr:hypothetical protein HanPI659440_Chr12g0475991 [Helianthus annuus]
MNIEHNSVSLLCFVEELYVGPVGRHSCELIEYLEAIDGVSKIKDGCNPATWMLEVSTTAQELALGVDFTEIYKNAELFKRNKAMIAELSVPRPGTKDLFYPTQYSQFPRSVCSVSLETTVVVLASTQQDLTNVMGSMYEACLFLGIQNASVVQPVVDVE